MAFVGVKGISRQKSHAAPLLRSIPGVLAGQADASSKCPISRAGLPGADRSAHKSRSPRHFSFMYSELAWRARGSNPVCPQKFSIIQALLSVVQAAMARYRPSGEGLPQMLYPSAATQGRSGLSDRHEELQRLEA